jgi:uncharacterized membrane protein
MGEVDTTIAVIVAMSLSTYVLKAGGFWLVGRIDRSPRIEATLRVLPGAVVVSLLVAALAGLGLPGWLAAVAVVAVAVRTDTTLLPLVVGVGAVAVLRGLV